MKNILQKTFYGTAVLCLSLGVMVGLNGCSRQPQVLSNIDTAMGTVITQQIYVRSGSNESSHEETWDPTCEVIALMNRLEQETLSWREEGSEVARLNETAVTPQTLTPHMAELLAGCQEVSEKSGGAFDITIGSVSRLWNLDEWADKWQEEEYPLPTGTEIESVLSHTGYENVILMLESNATGTERIMLTLQNGVSLDLGAVGKGVALDEIKTYLETEKSVTGAVISAGGSILTHGAKPDGTPWKVGIVDPLDNSRNLGVLTLAGQWCVSTSGDYERYVEVDGVRYHHIIDPATGYPANNGTRSVTILCKSGFLSDALSTACFIMGEEKGMQLAEEYGAEALFVDEEGRITMTDGMREYFSQQ